MNEIKTEATSAGRVVNNSKNDINEIFVKKYGQKWLDYRKKWSDASKQILNDFPLFVRFENQFKCNARCTMCVHGHPDLRKDYAYKGYLDFDTFKRLVDECDEQGCPSVGVSQTNEPLLDPDIMERLEYISTKKNIMDIHFNTNASLLSEEISRRMLDTNVSRMNFSVDAMTEETYNKIRIGLDFNTVINNIETFLNLRAKMGKNLPIVRISFLLQQKNKHELEAFKKYWVDKVDYVAIQRYVPISPFGDERSVAIPEAPIDGKQSCSYPFESLFIHGDGLVVPCASHAAKHIAVGNIHNDSIYNIWHSKGMQELRDAHIKGDLSKTRLCDTCLFKG
ncbi:heme biosynthesis protein [Campylobacter hyointestinalis]|uniref:radical SAM/SPASM domain-containing protein n=1 Tax=Campylobacter hyointestinalis TaxID=198 RepID=UPI00072B9BC7|nr:radical SAM protein [Campylobacter hyointestinalis]PPB56678.1 radical SAM/SPASM domain-containing protein [Campylobacter hyointestinalis subsp. hyointestinalis]CUU71670.1 heme biosynthesis protein [Campylobacter hyointestinalis]